MHCVTYALYTIFVICGRHKDSMISDTELEQIKDNKSAVLRSRRLKELPQHFDECDKLIELDISHNEIRELPHLGSLIHLQYLRCSSNKIATLPNYIGNFVELRELCVDINLLSDLPKSIAKLTNLNFLDIGNNDFTTIPSQVFALHTLTTLCLSFNELDELPPEMVELRNLINLDVRGNNIKTFHVSILDLAGTVDELQMEDNPLQEVGEGTNLGYSEIVDVFPRFTYDTCTLHESKACGGKWNTTNLRKLTPRLGLRGDLNRSTIIFNFKRISKCARLTDNEVQYLRDYINCLYNPRIITDKRKMHSVFLCKSATVLNELFECFKKTSATLYKNKYLKAIITATKMRPDQCLLELIYMYIDLINVCGNELTIKEKLEYIVAEEKMRIFEFTFTRKDNPQNLRDFYKYEYHLRNEVGTKIHSQMFSNEYLHATENDIELALQLFYKKFTPAWMIKILTERFNNDNDLVEQTNAFYFCDSFTPENKPLYFVKQQLGNKIQVTEPFTKRVLEKMKLI